MSHRDKWLRDIARVGDLQPARQLLIQFPTQEFPLLMAAWAVRSPGGLSAPLCHPGESK